jgi:hypothetical protein
MATYGPNPAGLIVDREDPSVGDNGSVWDLILDSGVWFISFGGGYGPSRFLEGSGFGLPAVTPAKVKVRISRHAMQDVSSAHIHDRRVSLVYDGEVLAANKAAVLQHWETSPAEAVYEFSGADLAVVTDASLLGVVLAADSEDVENYVNQMNVAGFTMEIEA